MIPKGGGKVRPGREFARRVALFVLRDAQGRVLMQLRTQDAPILPGHWGFFGGGIEKGESPEAAVRREAREELQTELEGLRLFRRYEFPEAPGLFEKIIFVGPLRLSVEELRRRQREGDDLGLFSIAELRGLKVSENDLRVLEDLFAG